MKEGSQNICRLELLNIRQTRALAHLTAQVEKKKQARQDPRYVADSNTISKTVNNGRNPQLIKSTSYISSRPDTAISHPISEQNIERERERKREIIRDRNGESER